MREAVEAVFLAKAVRLYSPLLQRCVELIDERDNLGKLVQLSRLSHDYERSPHAGVSIFVVFGVVQHIKLSLLQHLAV
jgi:hypothetical protein